MLESGGREGFDARAGAEGGQGFVETDVARLADAKALQVNAAKPLNGGLVAAAFLVEVGGEAVGEVGVPRIEVHVAEQMVVHVVAVGIRVGGE